MVIPAPFIENHYYHIFNRGNNREPIFFNEANYYYFISLIAKYIAMVANIIAYCLLVNHFHLLIKTKPTTKEAISEQFRRLFIAYSQAVNKEQKRSGSLFNSISADTKGNLIQIGFQNFTLAVLGLDLQRNQQFTKFAHIGSPIAEKQILGELLGDG